MSKLDNLVRMVGLSASETITNLAYKYPLEYLRMSALTGLLGIAGTLAFVGRGEIIVAVMVAMAALFCLGKVYQSSLRAVTAKGSVVPRLRTCVMMTIGGIYFCIFLTLFVGTVFFDTAFNQEQLSILWSMVWSFFLKVVFAEFGLTMIENAKRLHDGTLSKD